MNKLKKLIADMSGQLNVNLAVSAVLGLILCGAFIVIGIVVLQGVVDGSGIDTVYNKTAGTGDEFYYCLDNVTTSIESAMGMAGTLLLVIVGVAILMLLAGVMVLMNMFR